MGGRQEWIWDDLLKYVGMLKGCLKGRYIMEGGEIKKKFFYFHIIIFSVEPRSTLKIFSIQTKLMGSLHIMSYG